MEKQAPLNLCRQGYQGAQVGGYLWDAKIHTRGFFQVAMALPSKAGSRIPPMILVTSEDALVVQL